MGSIRKFFITAVQCRYTTSAAVIKQHIEALPRDGFKYKFASIEVSACDAANVALDDPKRTRLFSALNFLTPTLGPFHKTFFYREGFVLTDDGNHVGRVQADLRCNETADSPDRLPSFRYHPLSELPSTSTKAVCYHVTPLAILHYGSWGLSMQSWEAKMRRGAKARGYDEDSKCEGVALQCT